MRELRSVPELRASRAALRGVGEETVSRKLTYDTWLFAAALLLIVIGLVMIYSASAIITAQKTGSDNPYFFITRQCMWLIAGSVLMILLMHVDMARLRDRRVIALLMLATLG